MGKLLGGIFLISIIATLACIGIESDILFFNICGWCIVAALVIMLVVFINKLITFVLQLLS